MKKTITLGLSAAAMLITGVAYAAPGDATAKRDPNAVITRADAQAQAQARFTRMDVNKDGKLDQADRDARRSAMQTRMFERLDTNKDGQISKAEFAAAKGPEGRRGGKEARGQEARGQEARAKGEGFGRHHGRHGGMRGMRMADADKNGVITQAEFTQAALARFDRLDADKDGKVTPAERQAAREAMKAKWQQKRADKAAS